jgi:hypothetical protein
MLYKKIVVNILLSLSIFRLLAEKNSSEDILLNTEEPIVLNEELYEEIKNSKDSQEEYIEEVLEILRRPRPKHIFEGMGIRKISSLKNTKKKWTVLVYIAGDNDLYKFAIRNIEQLKRVGSNGLLNIVIHFDYHEKGSPKQTRRFYIERDEIVEIGSYPAMDSGSEKTLIDAGRWAITNFPSENFALVLWNHGSGDINPLMTRLINPSEFFYYDQNKKQIVLDRSVSFTEYLIKKAFERGICFDDSTGNYLDDTKLTIALQEICKMRKEVTGKNKIDIILFDACLMAGIGTATICYPYADYMTASQEVVLGPGYNYWAMIKPLSKGIISPKTFATHIIDSYMLTYAPITQDYTESAFELKHTENLIASINKLSDLIIHYIKFDRQNVIKKSICLCAHRQICTHFDEPSFIDLQHFLENLKIHTSKIQLKDLEDRDFYEEICDAIKIIQFNIKQLIIKNTSGKNLSKASGLSIYFPTGRIDKSFLTTIFAKKTLWLEMLKQLKN